MKFSRRIAAPVVIFAMAACDLGVSNPNAPDAPRAFSDPAGLEALISGAVRTWVATREDYFIMPLNMQADNYTASWNNAAIRFYSSVGSGCASRFGWTNIFTAPGPWWASRRVRLVRIPHRAVLRHRRPRGDQPRYLLR
jgi:hypothetical protein